MGGTLSEKTCFANKKVGGQVTSLDGSKRYPQYTYAATVPLANWTCCGPWPPNRTVRFEGEAKGDEVQVDTKTKLDLVLALVVKWVSDSSSLKFQVASGGDGL